MYPPLMTPTGPLSFGGAGAWSEAPVDGGTVHAASCDEELSCAEAWGSNTSDTHARPTIKGDRFIS